MTSRDVRTHLHSCSRTAFLRYVEVEARGPLLSTHPIFFWIPFVCDLGCITPCGTIQNNFVYTLVLVCLLTIKHLPVPWGHSIASVQVSKVSGYRGALW